MDPHELMRQMAMRSLNTPGLIQAIDRLARARTWEERRAIMERNPVLLTAEAEEWFVDQASLSSACLSRGVNLQEEFGPLAPGPDEAEAEAKGDQQILNLVRRCRVAGIHQAFEELRGDDVD